MKFLRQYGPFIIAILILLIAGTGGFYQVTSGLFYCGKPEAMPSILYWSIAIACQSLLFMMASLFKGAKKIYLLSQLIALPFLFWVSAQLANTYPGPFIAVVVMLGIYFCAQFLTKRLSPNQSPARRRFNPIELATGGSVFILTTLLIHSTLAFFILHKPGVRLTNTRFFWILVFSVPLAYFLVRKSCLLRRIRLSEFPPLSLLVFFLLRAKLPDTAYDSLFYKATTPIMIADWRTALTGTLDPTLLGTNFLEIINSQLRILDHAYSPAMTGAFAFIAMWLIAPQAAASFLRRASVFNGLVRSATILLLVSQTEPLIAAGTAYQEPFLILLVAASALAGPLGWFMMASAVSVKITALFFVPFWLLWRVMTVDREKSLRFVSKITNVHYLNNIKFLSRFKRTSKFKPWFKSYASHLAVLICLILSFTVVGEQLYRNYALTGRIFAPSESLVSITDPHGEILKRTDNLVFDGVAQRGALNNLGTTIIHMLTLDKLIKTDDLGFHIMPSSRLPVVAFLCIFLIFFKKIRAKKHFIWLTIGYVVSFTFFLNFFLQGRHMAAASVFAVFVVATLLSCLINLVDKNSYSSILMSCMVVGITFFAVSDQTVGSYINNGWDCHRPLLATPIPPRYEMSNGNIKNNDVEKVLADITQRYRITHDVAKGVIPSILDVEQRHYFGANYVYSQTSQDILKNYLDVDSKRATRLPYSLLAICFENEKFFTDLVPQDVRPQFFQFAKVGKTTIMASKPLLSGAMAESITDKRVSSPQLITDNEFTSYDFVAKWLDEGKLTNDYPAETPTGKGSLKLIYDNINCAVLVFPYSIQFSNVYFATGDSIELEYAMPYSKSEGMNVKLTIVAGDKQHSVQFPVSPRSSENEPMDWKKESVKIPPELSGNGVVIISALSENGDSSVDWIAFRKLSIQKSVAKN